MPRRSATVFRSLRVPNALPFVFTALRVATTLATIGAIVAEYFASPRGSLGQYIATQSAFLAFERSWAAIIFAAAIGIGLYLLVVGLERRREPVGARLGRFRSTDAGSGRALRLPRIAPPRTDVSRGAERRRSG